MPRRRRSFFFNNKHKKLLTNTTATVKTSRTTSTAGLKLEGFLDANGNHIDMGSNNITDTKVGQWDTAYGWGNHASAGYSTTTYSNSDVDSHLNQSNPTSGYVLSWNGSDYAWVAQSTGFSGNYNDLTNKPTIPTNNNQLTNGAGYITSTVSGDFDIVGDVKAAGMLRGTGWWNTNSSDRSGYAVEIGWSGGEGYLLAYSRTNSAYGSMNFTATDFEFHTGAVSVPSLASTGSISWSGGHSLRQGNVANNIDIRSNTTGGAGVVLKDSGGTFKSQWYGTGSDNGFLTGEWGAWDLRKTINGQLLLRVSSTDYTTWHSGNDGSGSGLDADLLDGQEGSYYLNYNNLSNTPTIPTNNNQLTNGAGYITNGSNYNVNNAWLRENGDDADVKLYGNSRQMTFRTDGTSGGVGGHAGYPFRWLYGGNAEANTVMLLHTDGRVWTPYYGWLNDAMLRKNATDTQTNTINMNGYFVGGADGHREKGIYGNYNSYRINNIWSMGTSYKISSAGTGFGNLYGMAYTYHNRVYTSNTMGQYHQMVWCNNGTPYCALGRNVWTSGNVTAYSDIRVKENLEIIPNALEKVSKLNGYTFDRTDIETDNEGNTPKKRQAGVVAQEVLEVLPEVVSGNEDDPDGHLSVAYGNMVGLLIEAIKEQQEQIEELKARLQ